VLDRLRGEAALPVCVVLAGGYAPAVAAPVDTTAPTGAPVADRARSTVPGR